jgi:hypothetical protein
MSTATHTVFYASALLIATVLVLAGALSLNACLWISLALFALLLTLAWRRFGGGRHPCFLFLGTLLLFQMGRLVGYAFGATRDPFDVVVQTVLPMQVSTAASELTLLIVLASATCVYTVCAWNARSVTLPGGEGAQWLAASYVLLVLSFPFVLYKNYEYFEFIRSHGGYLAIFTDSEEVAASAGALVRVMSLIAANAFLLAYVLERNTKRLAWVTAVFLSTSMMELAIGLRGKVFLFLITLWFLHNLKTGRRFRAGTLAMVGVVASFAAVAISGFREMRATAMTGPASFVAGQGISMGVTQVAIEFRPLFAPHAASYLEHEILEAFYPGSHFEEGEIFDNDVSIFLNSAAFREGFGAGGSYLAEAWIAGRMLGVLCASVLIGLVLRGLNALGSHWVGAVAVAALLPAVIYLPRAGMLSPLATAVKSGIVFAAIVPCLWGARWLLEVISEREPDAAQGSAAQDA